MILKVSSFKLLPWSQLQLIYRTKKSFKGEQVVAPSNLCRESNLQIDKVEKADAGEYLLIVRNIYGVQQVTMWLEVESDQTSTSSSAKYCDIHFIFLFLALILKQNIKLDDLYGSLLDCSFIFNIPTRDNSRLFLPQMKALH